jgi:hypothetical protein
MLLNRAALSPLGGARSSLRAPLFRYPPNADTKTSTLSVALNHPICALECTKTSASRPRLVRILALFAHSSCTRYQCTSFKEFSRLEMIRTTGPFQNIEAVASFQCVPAGYRMAGGSWGNAIPLGSASRSFDDYQQTGRNRITSCLSNHSESLCSLSTD